MTLKKSPSNHSPDLVPAMLKGDRRALARLMTYVDNRHESLMTIMQKVYDHTGRALKVGITGPPGAGKSTLVDKLIKFFRSQKKKVGVVAVDPSSPFSGGAVLGDRIRMMDHGADDNVFIRSLGTRGSHGGLSRATRDVVHLFDAFGMDVVLIETVGVGQTELDIMSVAHVTVVVLVPESGDTIQTMKAGLMEIADIFVVNKADREGANRIFSELQSLSQITSETEKKHHGLKQGEFVSKRGSSKTIPVFKTEAHKAKGVETLAEAIVQHGEPVKEGLKKGKNLDGLLKEECEDIFLAEVRTLVDRKLQKGETFDKVYHSLSAQHHNPYRAAAEILDKLKW